MLHFHNCIFVRTDASRTSQQFLSGLPTVAEENQPSVDNSGREDATQTGALDQQHFRVCYLRYLSKAFSCWYYSCLKTLS